MRAQKNSADWLVDPELHFKLSKKLPIELPEIQVLALAFAKNFAPDIYTVLKGGVPVPDRRSISSPSLSTSSIVTSKANSRGSSPQRKSPKGSERVLEQINGIRLSQFVQLAKALHSDPSPSDNARKHMICGRFDGQDDCCEDIFGVVVGAGGITGLNYSYVNFKHFICYLAVVARGSVDARMHFAYEVCDTNRAGLLNEDQIHQLTKHMMQTYLCRYVSHCEVVVSKHSSTPDDYLELILRTVLHAQATEQKGSRSVAAFSLSSMRLSISGVFGKKASADTTVPPSAMVDKSSAKTLKKRECLIDYDVQLHNRQLQEIVNVMKMLTDNSPTATYADFYDVVMKSEVCKSCFDFPPVTQFASAISGQKQPSAVVCNVDALFGVALGRKNSSSVDFLS